MKLTVQSFALIVVTALSLEAFAHDKHDNKAHDKGKASAAKAVKGGFLGKDDSDLNIHRLPSRFAHSPDWMKLAQ